MAKKTTNIPDDKDVYLAFSTVFRGINSKIRRRSAIKKAVHHNEKLDEVARFLSHCNASRDAIYDRLQVLLEQRVFESYLNAKQTFPDLFATSEARNAERAASEAEAATDHVRAIERALPSDQEEVDDSANDSDKTCAFSGILLQNKSLIPLAQERLTPSNLSRGPSVPLLFPMRLPFITGHRIFTETQTILEKACFDFSQHAMPETLSRLGWDCAEAVELNVWVGVFQKEKKCLFKSSPADIELDRRFYKSICDIRHTAVHRPHVTTIVIETCLRDAELLATLLDDEAAASRISTMKCELQNVTAEMEGHKTMLEARLARTLERIAAERVELDRQEREAIDGMDQADREYQLNAGASLEEKLTSPTPGVARESTVQVLMTVIWRTIWQLLEFFWQRRAMRTWRIPAFFSLSETLSSETGVTDKV